VHDATEGAVGPSGPAGEDYLFAYDAMGNVTQVIDWDAATVNDAMVASYEYDAYGQLFASSGGYATKNRWRMSTKQFDAETGFGYWGGGMPTRIGLGGSSGSASGRRLFLFPAAGRHRARAVHAERCPRATR
jgi:hypothetical protein